MKQILSFSLVILFAVACQGGPKIKFSSTKYNFGDVRQHKVVEKIFNFKNIGTETLHIKRVKAG